ncbi:MAG: peptidase prolyl oligopeptidase [Alphaproteobacteria bacterium]|nr:peptidase prolyl oligopeptidase [Alphaproteobacteria bacterium]
MFRKRLIVLRGVALIALALPQASAWAAGQAPSAQKDAALLFGEREDVRQMSLSPGGTKVAFVAPGPGPSTILYVADVGSNAAPRVALSADGRPNRIRSCFWVSDNRLVCNLYLIGSAAGQLIAASRIVAVDADSKNLKLLSRESRSNDAYVSFYGGEVIDALPDEEGAVLVNRAYVPQESSSTRMIDKREGLGVDRLDTRSLDSKNVEAPRRDAVEYISDGRGKVRIMGLSATSENGYSTGTINYLYRPRGSNGWKPLGTLDTRTHEGFNPYAVDSDLDVAYGFRRKDGRLALYSVALDGTNRETLVFSRPDVDVDGLVRIGRRKRVVGLTFATEKRQAIFFDKTLNALSAALSKALPGLPLVDFVDSNLDESKLLLWAGSDRDPGRYYLFDKATHGLTELMLSRADLEGAKLAEQKPITFKAADGTVIPAYLTLPPGSNGRGLPAIVMPHGGPASRDEWGFDWLAQYFAARGFAVLQPEFRGSAGYGDDYFVKNGFQSWRIAIGDVVDAGRWLAAQGIADPSKLAIFGWSYGGYAALQANVLDPQLFKAVVAVAPVTDLDLLAEERRDGSDSLLTRDFIGTGPHIREGSPAQNAAKLVAPVLLFHGDQDLNVGVGESRLMDQRLKAAGRRSELVIYPGLDHQLEDSVVRADMLRRSDAFIRAALKLP